MLKVERLANIALAREILLENWAQVSEFETDPDNLASGLIWIALYDDSEPEIRGVLGFAPVSAYTYITHVAIRPKYHKQKGNLQLGKMGLRLFFSLTPAEKLTALVPVDRKDVLSFAQRAGFKREGILRRSFRRPEGMIDQYVLGMNREQ